MMVEEAMEVVEALAAASPVYDYICCFFCGAMTPSAPPGVEETPDDGEDHTETCLWWMARQLVGLPKWWTAEEKAADEERRRRR